ncbi:MAG: hypothetical protein AB7O26_15275 [Planctomycetaceae bacterium]
MNAIRSILAMAVLAAAPPVFGQEIAELQSAVVVPESVVPASGVFTLQDAQGYAHESEVFTLSEAGFFFGVGGSYNSIKVKQDLEATADSEVSVTQLLVATGTAGGSLGSFDETESSFAPTLQLGYFSAPSYSDWAWGAKGSYRYLGTTLTNRFLSTQPTELTSTGNAGADTFAGHIGINAVRTEVNHEFALIPFLGHAFDRGRFYVGAGPVAIQTQTLIDQAFSYASVNGTPQYSIGSATDFSDTDWLWGGIGQIGLIYYIEPWWSIDLSYDCAVTGKASNSETAPFISATSDYVDTGTLTVDSSHRVVAQSFMISLQIDF